MLLSEAWRENECVFRNLNTVCELKQWIKRQIKNVLKLLLYMIMNRVEIGD